MSLPTGSRFGAYEIVALLGEGGMGQVYRARDAKLQRDVAIKVLPPEVAKEPERIARFTREAQALAALDHPGIAHIYGAEEHEGVHGLVMELVEGVTLAERIESASGASSANGAKGLTGKRSAVPVEEALAIARQIADAVASAHERGIVHRDLKPANIKVRPDGVVKVLDFGLAKALVGEGVAATPANSPTISLMATGAGVLLGTAAYMSPEQARGGNTDRRTDVWAFGCVLFEMLTGRQAFEGPTISDTLASVLRAEPDWSLLPPATPPGIVRLLERCLAKDRKQRLGDLHDADLDIGDALHDAAPPAAHALAPPRASSRWQLAIASVALVAGAALGWVVARSRGEAAAAEPMRLSIVLPETVGLYRQAEEGIEITPDGRTVVFVGTAGGRRALYRRSLVEGGVDMIPGTDMGGRPTISPDGQWVAFSQHGQLRKVALAGGRPVAVCDCAVSRITWPESSTLLASAGGGLSRVPASGGKPTVVDLEKDPRPNFIFNLALVPIGGATAVAVASGTPRSDEALHLLDLSSGRSTPLIDGGGPTFLEPDLFLFVRDSTLWASRLDIVRRTLASDPVPVLHGLSYVGPRPPLYAIAKAGHLVYATGTGAKHSLNWLDRQGRTSRSLDLQGTASFPAVSPDGQTLAVTLTNEQGEHIWLIDLIRGSRVRLTTSMASRRGSWTPDGQRMAFMNTNDVWVARVGSAEAPTRLFERARTQFPEGWSPDGETLVFNENEPRDIAVFRQGKVEMLVTGPGSDRNAAISPNGRWLMFVSDESGRDEVYVQGFPAAGTRHAVSVGGGSEATWSADGRQIYFRSLTHLMAAPFDPASGQIGSAAPLFEMDDSRFDSDSFRPRYAVRPDGVFLMMVSEDAGGSDRIEVILNFATEVRRKLGSR
jgi:Tol biopolymer transport system component